jgi:alpha-tubulin suppressor-like RCC1 family protein
MFFFVINFLFLMFFVKPWLKISTGSQHSLLLSESYQLYTIGYNDIGDGSSITKYTPTPVLKGKKITQIFAAHERLKKN